MKIRQATHGCRYRFRCFASAVRSTAAKSESSVGGARVHGRWEKGGEKPRSCFITKAADIKFHRQTAEFPRVRDTSVFTTFVCDRRSDETRTFPLRKYARKRKLRLPKERRGSVLQAVKAKNFMLDTGDPSNSSGKETGKRGPFENLELQILPLATCSFLFRVEPRTAIFLCYKIWIFVVISKGANAGGMYAETLTYFKTQNHPMKSKEWWL